MHGPDAKAGHAPHLASPLQPPFLTYMKRTPAEPASSLRVEYTPLGSKKRSGANRPERGLSAKGFLFRATMILAAAILPFFILVRLSVALYSQFGWGNWMSVLGAAGTTTALLIVYAWLLRVRIQGRLTLPRAVLGALAAVVGAYVIYLLVYLASVNAKSAEVRSEFSSLHPVMRVALSSVLLVDREAMVTDVGRTAVDYRQWGLSVNEASLHFEQPTGFVHAVDLRTRGRPAWRNALVAVYFRSMGFRTLRHVGTADHLHVSLPVP